MREFESLYLGQTPYSIGLERQRVESQKVRESGVACVLGLEHTPVVTLGKRASVERDLKRRPEELQKMGISLEMVDRGGEATMHTPGQLVIYPLVPIREWGIGVRDFVEALELVTLRTLSELGVDAFKKPNCEPGLYTSNGKIVFFGIRVDRGVSGHGLSLNVCNDLSLFDHIVSCGIRCEKFDSMKFQGINASPLDVYKLWIENFRHHFILTDMASPSNLASSTEMRS